MKILQIIPHFGWMYGGVPRVVFENSQRLAKLGHEVSIFTTDVGPRSRLAKGERLEYIEGVEVRYFSCLSNWAAQELKLHVSEDLRRSIRDRLSEYDIVHLHEWRGVPNAYVWHYSRKSGTPYVLQAHGSSPRRIGEKSIVRILSKRFYDETVGRRIVNDASALIALTHHEGEQYQQIGAAGKRIEIVPNGLDLHAFEELPARGIFRAKHSIDCNAYVVMYLGRINWIKGLDILVDAFQRVLEKIPESRLVIIGPDDGYLGDLRRQISDRDLSNRTTIVGPLYGAEKIQAYVDADVYVLPSRYDAFPLTLLEALASRTVTVSTTPCGLANEIRGRAGYVAKPDARSLSEAILESERDSVTREMFREEGRTLVKEKYSLDKMVKHLDGIYRSVTKERC
jgi:glycosyltransferase involved in cell wall biosynthesis